MISAWVTVVTLAIMLFMIIYKFCIIPFIELYHSDRSLFWLDIIVIIGIIGLIQFINMATRQR